MSIHSKLRALWDAMVRKSRSDDKLDGEVAAYLELLIEEKIEQGLAPGAARRLAMIELGGVEQVKERVRDVRTGRWLEDLWLDLRYGARTLRKSPGFTAAAILTLALAIGGTTAIFSAVNGVLLQPLKYPEPSGILTVCETSPQMPADYCGASPANSADWDRYSKTIESFGLARSWPMQIIVREEIVGLNGGVATPGVFEVFKTRPHIGRLFESRDLAAGEELVVLLAHELWKSRFGADPGVLGRRLQVDDEVRTIVGVLPPSFELPELEHVQLWIPLWSERTDWRGWRGFWSFGRLSPGATLEQARQEMAGLRDRLAQEFPEDNEAYGIGLDLLHTRIVAPVRDALWIFLGAIGFVLLIACVNIANLLLAKSVGRERELAVRAALGARRGRLIRMLVGESLVLGLAGGALGTLLAYWLVQIFRRLAPAGLPRLEEISVDGTVLAFTLLISVATGFLFGVVPAWTTSQVDFQSSLREGGRGVSGQGNRLRSVLAAVEIGLALVLLTGAGLLGRSFANLLDWEPGFDRRNVAMISVFNSTAKYPRSVQLPPLYRQVLEELATLPGVVSVGAGSAVPLLGGDGSQEYGVSGRPLPPPGERPVAWWYDVGPDYFKTLGIPLRQGRFFDESDAYESPRVVIVNQTLARRIAPDGDVVGKRIDLLTHEFTAEIVGVVGDVQPFHPAEAPKPEVYWPYMQLPRWAIMFVLRTEVPPAQLAEAVEARILTVDPDTTVGSYRTMDERVGVQLVLPRFRMGLLLLFAVLALSIASVGVYGVISFGVAQRTREFGIRMAMGAARGDVLRLVVRRGLALALTGIGLGLAGALALTRLLGSFLVEISATDPITFAATALLLAGAAALASWIPARRAARVDPMVALRYE